MFKPQNKIEWICRILLYSIMVPFTVYMIYLKYTFRHLTKMEFIEKIWGDYNWVYLIVILVVLVTLYIKSNLTKFKKLLKGS